jgi:hypothetical protein
MIKCCIVFFQILMIAQNSFAQQQAVQSLQQGSTDSTINKKIIKTEQEEQSLQEVPDKYLKSVNSKIGKYNDRLTKKTEKSLERLSKYETKIQSILQKTSPQTEQRLFGNGQMTFTSLLQKLRNGEAITTKYQTQYDAYNNKLTNQIKYLAQQKSKLDSNIVKPVTEANKNMAELNKEEDQTTAVQQFIKERKKQLMAGATKYLENSKYLTSINKEAFYYEATLKNYKEIFSDPNKAEQTATGILNKVPAFQKFTQQNSMLSSLFGSTSASDTSSMSNSEALAGLQTQSQVQGMIQQQVAAGGPNAQAMLTQDIQQAQAQLNQLKSRIGQAGGSSSDTDIPDFKPNMQKTKTFAQRLEYGFNIQFAKSSQWVPTTANIALTIGYKLSDKTTIGIGANYNLGMGTIQHIQFSSQGIGLRSFMDWKLKKQLFITGGFEMNNNPSITSIELPQGITTVQAGTWQQSGLIGLTKKMNIKSKYFKSTSIQLLYDMLANQHIPKSQPVLFRVGYNF